MPGESGRRAQRFRGSRFLHRAVSRLELLRDMLQRRLEPDAICYSAVASACEPPTLIQQFRPQCGMKGRFQTVVHAALISLSA